MPEISGECLCGSIRYSASGEPVFTGICHCIDCQRFTGAPFSVVVGVPKPAFSVTGDLKSFTKLGDSGQPVQRSFCPNCGASIADEAAALPDVVMIAAGTLHDKSWVKPAMQIYCDSAQPWVQLGHEMKSFPKMPG